MRAVLMLGIACSLGGYAVHEAAAERDRRAPLHLTAGGAGATSASGVGGGLTMRLGAVGRNESKEARCTLDRIEVGAGHVKPGSYTIAVGVQPGERTSPLTIEASGDGSVSVSVRGQKHVELSPSERVRGYLVEAGYHCAPDVPCADYCDFNAHSHRPCPAGVVGKEGDAGLYRTTDGEMLLHLHTDGTATISGGGGVSERSAAVIFVEWLRLHGTSCAGVI